MQKIIVSDTSCLILLNKINRLSLLKSLFGEVTITTIIAKECGFIIPEFILVEDPVNLNYQLILEGYLDKGEASALALALEKKNCLLIIDEAKGRKEAKQLHLNYTGTLGILLVAKDKGLISSISEILEEIKQTDFRISKSLLKEVILMSKE